jgi:adenylosuccinate synthase
LLSRQYLSVGRISLLVVLTLDGVFRSSVDAGPFPSEAHRQKRRRKTRQYEEFGVVIWSRHKKN